MNAPVSPTSWPFALIRARTTKTSTVQQLPQVTCQEKYRSTQQWVAVECCKTGYTSGTVLLETMSTTPSNTNSTSSFPVPQHSPPVVQSMTANDPTVSGSLGISVSQPHTTTPSGLTLRPPSPPLLSSSSHSGPLSSQLSLHNSTTSSSSSLGNDPLATQRREIQEAWIDAEGEIPVLNKDDGSWTLILSRMLVCKDSAGKNSWRDGQCALLDSHLLFLEKETSSSGTTRSSHIFRPIPLECLQLTSFNDKPEVRKHHLGLLKRVGSCFRSSPTKEQMYPFTVYHVAAKITRRYTLYTKSGTERIRWNVALAGAIKARKTQQDARMLYEPKVLNNGFFKIPPRIQFNGGTHYTGRIVCAVLFSFEGEDYIAVGCTDGIYISKHAVDYSFRKVLEFSEPTSVVAVPEFNKFIVHSELVLSSYSLELAIRVSQGDASSKPDLDNSEEKLAREHGNILFFKAGRIADRTFIVYASKDSKEVTLRTFELTQGQGPQTPAGPGSSYQPSGSPIPIPEDPHDATFFDNKVAICTPKAIYVMEPMNAANPCHKVVSNSEHDANAFQRLLKRTKTMLRLGKNDTPKILNLVGKASILGVVTRGNNMLVVYNDLGCLVDQAGQPADSNYYIEWERKATAFARRGPHLLLFSPGYIEVRNIDTGKLVRMVEVNELRFLCSGLTDMLVAAINTKDNDGGHTEKLVELIYCS